MSAVARRVIRSLSERRRFSTGDTFAQRVKRVHVDAARSVGEGGIPVDHAPTFRIAAGGLALYDYGSSVIKNHART